MKPFQFGRESELYGVFHNTDVEARVGVVFCAPFGNEAIVSYSAYRQLAGMLSRNDIPSIRFDYFASGDSMGEDTEFSLARAQRDVKLAIRELTDLTGVERVILVGVRIGANIALEAICIDSSETSVADIDGIVLVDPIIQGSSYLNAYLKDGLVTPLSDKSSDTIGEETVAVDGFPVTPALYQEISALDITQVCWPTGPRYWLTAEAPHSAIPSALGDFHRADNSELWSRSPGADMPVHDNNTLSVIRDWLVF